MEVEVIDVDPDHIFGSILPNAQPLVVLSMAVVKRALQDLTIAARHLGPEIQEIRLDAYEFLTETLWTPTCLWGEILGNSISRKRIMVAIKRRCRYEKGHVYTYGE